MDAKIMELVKKYKNKPKKIMGDTADGALDAWSCLALFWRECG